MFQPIYFRPDLLFDAHFQEAGHAFVLRRYDTGAVSLTTMFRAAFPLANEQEEKAEIQWVRDTYDLSGTNGSAREAGITRLAGTWVHPPLAIELGKTYALGPLIETMIDAAPDPKGSYRRSAKGSNKDNNNVPPPAVVTPTTTTTTTTIQSESVIVSKPPSATKSLPTPSPTTDNPPAKRRKESSPAPSQTSVKPPSRASPVKPPSTTSTAPRRSARTKSPAPRTLSALTSVRTPKRALKKEQPSVSLTPGGSELTAVDEEGPLVEEGVAGKELMEEDIKEQRNLIENLKAQRAAAASQEEMNHMDVSEEEPISSSSNKKREREEEEEPLKFEFKEPEIDERPIASNRRVGRFNLEPRTKSFAWGVAAFAFGMGAV